MSVIGERGHAGERGATLLEMMVVVGVMALVAGVIFPNMRRPYDSLSSEAAQASMASELRDARASAVRLGRSVTFELSPDGRSYGWAARRFALPASTRAEMTPAAVTFTPNGESAGGRIVLWRGARATGVVEVEADTGVVGLGRPS